MIETESALDQKPEKWRLNAHSMQAQETDSACRASECAWHQGLLQLQETVDRDIPQQLVPRGAVSSSGARR